MEYIFWISLCLIVYTYIGYPALLTIMKSVKKKSVDKADITPKVAILIAAHNEETHIKKKLENSLSLYYPKEKLEIVVVSDGSTDDTNRIVESFSDRGVKLVSYPVRSGKAHAINLGVLKTKSEIVLFTDARQVLDKNVVRRLVSNFNDPKVGAVSGELHLISEEDSAGECYGVRIRLADVLIALRGTAVGLDFWQPHALFCSLPQS